mmetsp:Transcript_25318/g.34824  ORF Transcript_25318/g.34824 Transcript_25318/m.34824 type:complete len:1153 (-) Transcript_25318:1701-5159(-)
MHGFLVLFFLLLQTRNFQQAAEINKRAKLLSSQWIGTAFVISKNLRISANAIHSIEAVGFQPEFVNAVRPYVQLFNNSQSTIFASCLSVPGRLMFDYFQSSAKKLSLSDLARICSHRKVLHKITSNGNISDSGWSLIVEDGVALHPSVTASHARLLLGNTLLQAVNSTSKEGFIYLEVSGTPCKGDNRENYDFVTSTLCLGQTTVAYAITKRTARTLYEGLYADHTLKSHELKYDNTLAKFINTTQLFQAVVVGWNLSSPQTPDHYGLMYHIGNKEENEMNDEFEIIPKFNIQITSSFLGDMLFRYSTLVSQCMQKSVHPRHCASITVDKNSPGCLLTALDKFNDLFPNTKYFSSLDVPINVSRERPYYSIKSFNSTKGMLLNLFQQAKSKSNTPHFFSKPNLVCLAFKNSTIDLEKQYIDGIRHFLDRYHNISIRIIYEDMISSSLDAQLKNFAILRLKHVFRNDANYLKFSEEIQFQDSNLSINTFDYEVDILFQLSSCANIICSTSALCWWGSYFATMYRKVDVFFPYLQSSSDLPPEDYEDYLAVSASPPSDTSPTSNWLGKAYVISNKLYLPDAVISAAQACGFSPEILPALLPYAEVYRSNPEDMYKKCIRSTYPYKQSNIRLLSVAELSLICSHLAAYQAIASDPTIYESDWSLIMEDDAVLHPSLTPSKARRAVEDSIKLANRRGGTQPGFMYFGICAKDCFGSTAPTSQQDIQLGLNCYGYCTHAYAIKKKTASIFLKELYDKNFISRKMARSQIDQALLYFIRTHLKTYKSKLHSIVIGVNLVSPDFDDHNGLMYQCNRTKSAIEKGTSLTSGAFRSLPCYRMVLSESNTVSNSLFQIATLVGACIRAETHPKFCASLISSGNSNSAALQSFMTSALSLSPIAKCSLRSSIANEDSEVVQTLISNTNKSDILDTFGATLKGSFRQLRYFHPHATRMLYEMISKVGCFYVKKQKYCFPVNEVNEIGDVCVSLSAFQSTSGHNIPEKSILSYYIAAIDSFKRKNNPSSIIRLRIINETVSPTPNEIKIIKSLQESLVKHYQSDQNVRFQFLWSESLKNQSPYVLEMSVVRNLATCSQVIASNSLLSWWGAYFATQIRNAVVIVPVDNNTVSPLPTLFEATSTVTTATTTSTSGLHLPSWHVMHL